MQTSFKQNNDYSDIFNDYRETAEISYVFPARGVSFIQDKSIFEDLVEGLIVDFVPKDNSYPNAVALEIGGEFIGWMPKEMAETYCNVELKNGNKWSGIIKYYYPPRENKNPGVRIELVPNQLKPTNNEMSEVISKKHGIDIEEVNDLFNSLKQIINGMYNEKRRVFDKEIFNTVNMIIKYYDYKPLVNFKNINNPKDIEKVAFNIHSVNKLHNINRDSDKQHLVNLYILEKELSKLVD